MSQVIHPFPTQEGLVWGYLKSSSAVGFQYLSQHVQVVQQVVMMYYYIINVGENMAISIPLSTSSTSLE